MRRFVLGSVFAFLCALFTVLSVHSAKAESGFLDITNSTDAEVAIIAVAQDKTQTELYRLPAGETYSLPVDAGTLLGFANGSSWVGDGYVVSGTDGEAVTIPYAEESAADAPEVTGNDIALKNTTGGKVTVIAIGEDKSQQKVADIAAGKTAHVRVPAGTLLGFAQGGAWVGDGYTVSDDAAQSASIPHAENQEAANPEAGSGGGVTIGNTSAKAITVVSIDGKGKQTPLFNVPAGKSASAAIKKGTTLGFAQGGEWLGEGYTVTGAENEPVMVPIAAQAAENAAAAQDEQAVAQNPVVITNGNDATIGVVAVDQDGTQSIVAQIKAGQTARYDLPAGTKLGFSIKGGDGKLTWSGDAFLVPDGGGDVQVPYHAVAGKEAPDAAQTAAKATPSAEQAAQSGAGSIQVNFGNRQSTDVVVAALGEDKTPHPLYSIKAGTTQSENALPGTTLMFYDSKSLSRLGDAYVVKPDGNDIELPYDAAAAFLKDQLKKAPAIAPAQLFNFHKATVAVYAKDGDAPAVKINEIAPGNSAVPVLATGTKLFFVEEVPGQESKAVGGSYTVAKGAQPIGIPYQPPSELVEAWTQKATLKISLSNMLRPDNPASYRPSPVFVMSSDPDAKPPEGASEDEAPKLQVVGMIYPMAPYEQFIMAPPKSVLRFVIPAEDGGEPAFYGEGYLVTDKPASINLPFATPLEDQLVAQIDLNKLAQDIAASLIKANMESGGPKACWKNTETRGVGTVPRNCLPNQVEDTAGLCYEKCKPGYYSNKLTMCIPECPAGFRDDGLYCFKPAPITRDAYPWEFGDGFSMDDAMARCRKMHGSDCVFANNNTMVYSTCPANYQQAPVITNLCTPTCPAGMTDIGISCQKNTYDRGVGQLMQCDPGQERDAGLCYTPCKAGYDHVGPVCWKQCPKSMPFNCGASCAKTEGDCAESVVNQVTSPLITAGNIALIVVTAGGAAAATSGAEAGGAAAKVGAEVGTEIAAKEAVKAGLRESLKAGVRSALKSGAFAAFKAGGKAVLIDQAKQAAISAILTGGISGGIAIAAKKKMETALNEKLSGRLSSYFTDEQIETVVNTAIEASGSGKVDFPLESLDPTGIAQIVVSYNLPLCSDVKDTTP